MYKGKRIAVVVPAFNEEKLIGDSIKKVPAYVDSIIVVDDCSSDNTLKIAKSHKKKVVPELIVIHHEVNQGVGAAIITGYKKAIELKSDIAAVMAGDAQMDPEYLPDLLDPIIDDRADYTKGNRLFSKDIENMPRLRQRGNAILTLLTKISSGYWDIIDPQNGYAAASSKVLTTIDLDAIHKRYGYCNDILVKLNIYNFRVMDVEMPPVYGEEKSGIKVRSYTFKMSWLLTKCFFHRISKKYGGLRFHPLILFFSMGLILFPFGLALSFFILFIRLTGNYVTDGSMILASLLLIVGLQLLLFGLLFDMMSSRYGAAKEPGKTQKQTKTFHPTIIGLFRRISSKYWGTHFHPIALFYAMGIMLFLTGFLMGIYILYFRIFFGGYTLGSIILTSLFIIIGMQSIFFAMIFEMESVKK